LDSSIIKAYIVKTVGENERTTKLQERQVGIRDHIDRLKNTAKRPWPQSGEQNETDDNPSQEW
jgi:hypothetical protein